MKGLSSTKGVMLLMELLQATSVERTIEISKQLGTPYTTEEAEAWVNNSFRLELEDLKAKE